MVAYGFNKISAYLKHYGALKLFRKALERKNNKSDYNAERISELATKEELELQRKTHFDYEPVISIIVPTFNTPKESFIQTLTSVKEQSYTKWELCIADGGNVPVKEIVCQVFGEDSRIKYKKLEQNMGISGNSNAGIVMAEGDFIALLDHDDILEPNVLYEIVVKINEGAEMVYTDEDKVNEALTDYFRPYRKPDYNKALFLSNNYICHFCAIKKSIVDKIGGFKSEYDGAQDYDLFLRCSEETDKIAHVSKVLYHWRISTSSTSDNPFNKEYAFGAGKKALEDYLERQGFSDKAIVEAMEDPGYFRIQYTGMLDNKDDYEFVLGNTEITEEQKEALIRRAIISGSDIVVPKILYRKKYFYNGIAKRGDEYTQSLKGKPYWYRGGFNMGITNMNVNEVPGFGILVKSELADRIKAVSTGSISNLRGEFAGLKMVYAPEVVITLKGKINE